MPLNLLKLTFSETKANILFKFTNKIVTGKVVINLTIKLNERPIALNSKGRPVEAKAILGIKSKGR